MKEELKKEKELKEKYLEGWKRAQADLINYKKEESQRLSNLSKYVKEEFILEILPVLDNIYLAEEKLKEKEKKDQWTKGFLKIKDQLLNILKKEGVEEIECLNKKVDLKLHEIMGEVESKKEPETIVEIEKRGYMINGRVLRPAKVKISKRSEKSH